MNLLDLFILALAVSVAIGGWEVGFVERVASWIGALGALALAVWVLPSIVRGLGTLPALTDLLVIVGTILLSAALGGAAGELVGRQLRRVVMPGPARTIDRIGGAAMGIVGLTAALWLLLPVLPEVPGTVAQQARRSVVLRTLERTAPRPPNTLQALRSLVGDSRFPQVFDQLRAAPDTGPPPADIPVPPDVVARATLSTVKVESVGCGELHEGSGFAVSADTIATNAHVVAGGQRFRVRRPDGRILSARVVVFDPNRDLALLHVDQLREAPLALVNEGRGTQGAFIGHPGGQDPPRVAAAIVRDEAPTTGFDIYGAHRTRRDVLYVAAQLRPGDSGGPLIDRSGRVLGIAFAIAPDRPATAYALAAAELQALLAAPTPSGAGPCM